MAVFARRRPQNRQGRAGLAAVRQKQRKLRFCRTAGQTAGIRDSDAGALESDLDLPAEIAYKAYENRREIEIVMRYCKSACEFGETRVHDDYSVTGSEFCGFHDTAYKLKKTVSDEDFESLSMDGIAPLRLRWRADPPASQESKRAHPK
jgi:hypothetical protein